MIGVMTSEKFGNLKVMQLIVRTTGHEGHTHRCYRYEQLKVERTQANLDDSPEMTSLMEKLHRFVYDDICEVEENVMVTICIATNSYLRIF